MSLFTAQLHPGRALDFLVLGASLHDILTRLKAEPQRFPKLDLAYSPTLPVGEPVVLTLPANGIRLRFDGPEQRLRLIEIVDFSKNHIIFKEHNKDRDLFKPTTNGVDGMAAEGTPALAGPTFRHIYSRFLGPTYDGEFIPASGQNKDEVDTYVLSYPGVAFTFPMTPAAYSPDKDVVSLLSSPSGLTALSMAVFSGESWAQARANLWTDTLPAVKSFAPLSKGGKDSSPDEISLVKIHGGGKLQLFRRWTTTSFFWITLGATTPQELVTELGPPDAIYRKSDQRMYIHKIRTASSSRSRPGGGGTSTGGDLLHRRQDDHLTDTDQSSAPTASEEDSEDDTIEDEFSGNVSGECFFNYFYLGFDVLVTTPTQPSRTPPSHCASHTTASTERPGAPGAGALGEQNGDTGIGYRQNGGGPAGIPGRPLKTESPDRLVATKLVLHGNVPGSYPFNRHRRCRWEITYLADNAAQVNSETPFSQVEENLHEEWKSIYTSEEEARQRQRGMVLNRGWGDSPGSSIELLGGWEGHKGGSIRGVKGAEDSTTTLYGFPGLVFEVLKNGFVSALTVF